MNQAHSTFKLENWPVVSEAKDSSSFVCLELEQLKSKDEHCGVFESFDGGVPRKLSHYSQAIDKQSAIIAGDHDEEIKKQLADEYQRGLKEGEKKGIELGAALAKQEYEVQMKRIETQIGEAVEEFREITQHTEIEAVKLAIDVARKVIEIEAEMKPEYVIDVIRRGLRNLGAGEVKRIRLAEPDFEFMRIVGFPFDISANALGVDYVVDEQQKNGCVFETNFGEIDLRLDEMWTQIRQQILGGDE